MRKKYLSALLFGALLATSAGTFTSCKDYDDEINSLRQDVTDLQSAVKSLEDLVKNGKYVTDVAIDGQTITFTFSDDTTKPIAIPEGEKGQLVEVKGDELYIDNNPTGIKVSEDAKVEEGLVKAENGTWWVLGEDGKYTNTNIPVSGVTVTGSESTGYELTIYNGTDKQVIKLPTAASTISSLSIKENLTIGSGAYNSSSTPEIAWGYNSNEQTDAMKNWKGPKGAVAKNQTMVGQIFTVDKAVTVTPASVDLGAMDVKLVDSKGNEAPAKVVLTVDSDEDLATAPGTSRAASTNGMWDMTVELDDFTGENIKSAFMVESNYKLYALKVNGTVMTPYDIMIKVDDTKNSTNASFDVTKLAAKDSKGIITINNSGGNKAELKTGETTTFAYTDANCYDAYLSFESAADKAKAEDKNIVVDGMKITVPADASNVIDLTVTVNIMNVNGTVNKGTIVLTTTGSATQDNIELSVTTVKVMPETDKFKVDLTKAVAGLTNYQISKITSLDNINVIQPDGQDTFLKETIEINYFNKDKKKLVNTVSDSDKEVAFTSPTQINYAEVTLSGKWTTGDNKAKPGDYKLIMTMYDGVAGSSTQLNELRKVNIPVSVTLPTFNEIFPRSAQWNGDTFSGKLGANKAFDYSLAFNFNNDNAANLDAATVSYGKIGDKDVTPANGEINASNIVTLGGKLIDKNALITSKLATTMSINVVNGNDNFKVESKFTTEIHSEFEQPKLVYYVNGVAQDVAKLEAGNIIKSLYTVGDDKVKNGLAIQYGRGEDSFYTGVKVDGVEIAGNADTAGKVTASMSIDGVSSASVGRGTSTNTIYRNMRNRIPYFKNWNDEMLVEVIFIKEGNYTKPEIREAVEKWYEEKQSQK